MHRRFFPALLALIMSFALALPTAQADSAAGRALMLCEKPGNRGGSAFSTQAQALARDKMEFDECAAARNDSARRRSYCPKTREGSRGP